LIQARKARLFGYAALQGCRRIADSYWVPPEDFTDPRWRPIYACILNLHRAGREVNYLTINDEIIRLKWESRLDKEIGPAGWQSWSALCDSSIQFSHHGVIECLKDIRRLAAERLAHEVIKEAADGKLTLEQTIEKLQAAREGMQAHSLDALLESRRFDHAKPPERGLSVYLLGRHCIATPGNIQVIAAQAKAGKSALVGAFIASTLGEGDTLGVVSANPDEHAVIHLDTEQKPSRSP
jgi:hypothetical protein